MMDHSRFFLTKASSAFIVNLWLWRRKEIALFFFDLNKTLNSLSIEGARVDQCLIRWIILVYLIVIFYSGVSQYFVWSGEGYGVNLTLGLSAHAGVTINQLLSGIDSLVFTVCSYGSRLAISGLLCIVCSLITVAIGRVNSFMIFEDAQLNYSFSYSQDQFSNPYANQAGSRT